MSADFWFQQQGGGPNPGLIGQSLRFRGAQTLSRTPNQQGNNRTFTMSVWVKGAQRATQNIKILTANNFTVNDHGRLGIEGSRKAAILNRSDLGSWSPLFRDYSAWYHLVYEIDTTQAVAADRTKLWVNGVLAPNETNVAQNVAFFHNNNGSVHRFMFLNDGANSSYSQGYLAEVHWIDGTAYDATHFGEFNADGVWLPKEVTGINYGVNGCYLDFSDPNNIGADRSGNGNNWTPTGFELTNTTSANYDWMADSPTNNFSTWNVLRGRDTTSEGNNPSYSLANLGASMPRLTGVYGTQAAKTGKYYFEVYVDSAASDPVGIGIAPESSNVYWTNEWDGVYLTYTGAIYPPDNSGAPTPPDGTVSWTTGSVVRVAVDCDAQTVMFSEQGNTFKTYDYSGFTGQKITQEAVKPAIKGGGNNGTASMFINTGQFPFNYSIPDGYEPWSTASLPEVPITNPSEHFQTVLNTGANILNSCISTFDHGLYWIKDRVNSNDFQLINTIDGVNLTLRTPDRNEARPYTTPTGNSIGWCWKTDASGLNAEAGFQMIRYRGDGNNGRKIAHQLGKAPEWIMTNTISGASNEAWVCWHKSFNANQYIILNDPGSKLSDSNIYGGNSGVVPDANEYTVGAGGTTNQNGREYIAYVWTSVPGFSQIGTYTGNSNENGPFVGLNFTPGWFMIKDTNQGQEWNIRDTVRSTYNPSNSVLQPNAKTGEQSGAFSFVDIVSNGFKIRNTHHTSNSGSQEYIYIAFAEHPFGASNVSPSPAR